MQIKAHVPELTNLYIAQVKRKYGLDVGYNYNLTKKENAKVSKPPEKGSGDYGGTKVFSDNLTTIP